MNLITYEAFVDSGAGWLTEQNPRERLETTQFYHLETNSYQIDIPVSIACDAHYKLYRTETDDDAPTTKSFNEIHMGRI